MSNFIQNFEKANILVIGDIMLDRFIYGDVSRISPEGPIPILSVQKEQEMMGGAGNVFANIRSLGAIVDIISVIGADEAGKTIRNLVKNDVHLIENQERPTILKTRYIGQNQQLLRVDHEQTDNISQNIQKEILEKADTLLKNKNILVISDYNKGVLTTELTSALIQKAKKNNITVIVDPKGTDFSKYAGATVITPNKKELSEATNHQDLKTDQGIENAAQEIQNKHNIETVIATRSEDGISVIEKNSSLHIPTNVREVFDVSGAGDTVIATVATVLGAGGSLTEAAQISNITAGLAVAKIGTAVITQTELKNVLQNDNQISSIAPILEWEQATDQIKQWQAQNLTVGMTGGCFDIIHYGHVNYLDRARARCDRLVIALNHDDSVKILKGPSRPVNDQNARATVMAALASVDMVVLFGAKNKDEDNTPSAILETLKPGIFFKGGDYTVDQLPEGKVVLNYGGKVDIMPLYDGYSTTNIIEKSQKN